jgi:Ca2+/Na+ antiporter
MKNVIIVLILVLIAFVTSSTEANSYSLIERSLPLVLGAALGGVLACTSIIVGVLSASSKATKQKAKQSDAFVRFVGSLESDVKILVVCLFFAVALPYMRTLDYPITIEILDYSSEFLKNKFFSTAQIFVAFVAFAVIYEIVSVVVSVLRSMMVMHDTEN